MEMFFEGEALIFTIPAILGTLFFVGKTALMMAGGVADADVDVDADMDIPADGGFDGVDALSDSTDAFKLLSIQALAGFVMGFGWAGMIGYISLEWGIARSAILATVGGLVVAWLVAWAFKLVYSLQESGNIPISRTVGKEGNVYASVPARTAGKGQVKLVVNQRARIYNAITEGESLPTNTRVRVVKVNNDNSVTVVQT